MPAKDKTPAWLPIERQLDASGVTPGSALEKLIKENQDFHMLRAAEAHDKLELPAWLRVYWRKLHPDADYSGPGGGYPLLLADLYEWMLEHQDLKPPMPDVIDPTDPRRRGPAEPKGC